MIAHFCCFLTGDVRSSTGTITAFSRLRNAIQFSFQVFVLEGGDRDGGVRESERERVREVVLELSSTLHDVMEQSCSLWLCIFGQ